LVDISSSGLKKPPLVAGPHARGIDGLGRGQDEWGGRKIQQNRASTLMDAGRSILPIEALGLIVAGKTYPCCGEIPNRKV